MCNRSAFRSRPDRDARLDIGMLGWISSPLAVSAFDPWSRWSVVAEPSAPLAIGLVAGNRGVFDERFDLSGWSGGCRVGGSIILRPPVKPGGTTTETTVADPSVVASAMALAPIIVASALDRVAGPAHALRRAAG